MAAAVLPPKPQPRGLSALSGSSEGNADSAGRTNIRLSALDTCCRVQHWRSACISPREAGASTAARCEHGNMWYPTRAAPTRLWRLRSHRAAWSLQMGGWGLKAARHGVPVVRGCILPPAHLRCASPSTVETSQSWVKRAAAASQAPRSCFNPRPTTCLHVVQRIINLYRHCSAPFPPLFCCSCPLCPSS